MFKDIIRKIDNFNSIKGLELYSLTLFSDGSGFIVENMPFPHGAITILPCKTEESLIKSLDIIYSELIRKDKKQKIKDFLKENQLTKDELIKILEN